LGKSIKPVPVMLLGVLIARKRYPLKKYLYVLLIVFGMNKEMMLSSLIIRNILGVVLFMYKEPKEAAKAGEMFGIGEFLLVRYLE
jgi:hypothetical protein